MIETVPTYFKEKEPPIISYTYTKTIANKIFNFSSTVSDLDYHQFHNNPSQCERNTSSHLYQPYGHVITGDLSIIPNFKLRDLIAKGQKYREPCKVYWDKNLSLLCEAVDQYALQCQMSSEDIINTHNTFMKSLGIELSDNNKKLPYFYWTPKLHKSPVKHHFIAGSSKCTTKELSSLLTLCVWLTFPPTYLEPRRNFRKITKI